MKYWLGDKNFPQRKLLPNEIFPYKVYLTFMKVLNKSGPPAKRPPTSFSALTPTIIGIRSQNFLTYSFSVFTTLVKFQGHT